ncbi:hypothetical protein SAMN06295912_108134 [Sphingomonas laterariae]|uniref:Uncharacterized protein n=1 Tax=Edaphosphingomonas laterariae TaxID=861865 RepID=A0A239F9S6_9SPHN|nr:hypothetical protein [Sphingomonas laterariae]SNS53577.1 hypothetical protein SAMN06295912_108134 [Sphingomonas laterariae]
MKQADYQERVRKLGHALQSGVAADHSLGSEDGSPKHLRVGVNMALVEGAAIAQLLIGKGLVSEDEWQAAHIIALEREVESYRRSLSERLGREVTLA